MRTIIFMVIAVFLYTAPPSQANTIRECLKNSESGASAPTSNRPDAKWLYVVNLSFSEDESIGVSGSNFGWVLANSLEAACNEAINRFKNNPANSEKTIYTAVVILVPDTELQRGLEH